MVKIGIICTFLATVCLNPELRHHPRSYLLVHFICSVLLENFLATALYYMQKQHILTKLCICFVKKIPLRFMALYSNLYDFLYYEQRLFASLESGCNGCIFIQMHKRAGDPGPVEIVQNMMSSAASTRKHMSRFRFGAIAAHLPLSSLILIFKDAVFLCWYRLLSCFHTYKLPIWMHTRFILRVLPAEVACYASEEEITKAISPLVEKYFPKECPSGHKASCLPHCFIIFLVILLLGTNGLVTAETFADWVFPTAPHSQCLYYFVEVLELI